MKKNVLSIILTFILIFSFCFFVGCNSNKNDDNKKGQPAYDQSHAFGIGETLLYDNPTEEDIEKRVMLMKDVGAKSIRFWFRNGRRENNADAESFIRIENNQLVINEKYKNKVKYSIQKLIENGIDKIIFDVYYMYGKTSNGEYIYYETNFPEIGSADYILYMQSIEEQFKTIAETFPEITYFEMGNEMNGEFTKLNNDTKFSNADKATLVLDFSYHALKGIKAGNPNAKGVLNGLAECTFEYRENNQKYILRSGSHSYIASFLNLLYSNIESGKFPTVGEKTTKIEDFFEVLAWHLYSADTLDKWIQYNNFIYDIVKEHGDDGRPVFITEYGIQNVTNQTQAEKTAGEVYCEIINNIDETPFIETLTFFILTDNDWERNKTVKSEKTYVLCYKKFDGSYDYSDAYIKLKESFGKN